MKICFVADLNSIHTMRWIQPVIDAKHEVYAVSYHRYYKTYAGIKEIIDLPGMNNLRKIRFLVWGLWLRGYLRKIKPDILHAHQITAAGWICAMSGFHPLVVTGWGSDILLESQKSLLRKLLIKSVLSRADYLTVPSQHLRTTIVKLRFPYERLYLIPWGIETDIFKPDRVKRQEVRKELNIPGQSPIIFCPRAIQPIYNLDIVISACHSLLSTYPDLRLLLLRYNIDQDYIILLEKLIKSLQMQENVIWLAAQGSLIEMASLYQASDIVVSIPSSEGYGFTLFEALACGIPVIISDLPVFDDLVQDHEQSLKVPTRDTVETARALHLILSDPQLCQTLSHNGLEMTCHLSAHHRADQVEQLYQFILAHH